MACLSPTSRIELTEIIRFWSLLLKRTIPSFSYFHFEFALTTKTTHPSMINAIGTTKLGGERPDYHRQIECMYTHIWRARARSYVSLFLRDVSFKKYASLFGMRHSLGILYMREDMPFWHFSVFFSLSILSFFLLAHLLFSFSNIQEDIIRHLIFNMRINRDWTFPRFIQTAPVETREFLSFFFFF